MWCRRAVVRALWRAAQPSCSVLSQGVHCELLALMAKERTVLDVCARVNVHRHHGPKVIYARCAAHAPPSGHWGRVQKAPSANQDLPAWVFWLVSWKCDIPSGGRACVWARVVCLPDECVPTEPWQGDVHQVCCWQHRLASTAIPTTSTGTQTCSHGDTGAATQIFNHRTTVTGTTE